MAAIVGSYHFTAAWKCSCDSVTTCVKILILRLMLYSPF